MSLANVDVWSTDFSDILIGRNLCSHSDPSHRRQSNEKLGNQLNSTANSILRSLPTASNHVSLRRLRIVKYHGRRKMAFASGRKSPPFASAHAGPRFGLWAPLFLRGPRRGSAASTVQGKVDVGFTVFGRRARSTRKDEDCFSWLNAYSDLKGSEQRSRCSGARCRCPLRAKSGLWSLGKDGAWSRRPPARSGQRNYRIASFAFQNISGLSQGPFVRTGSSFS